MNIDELLATAPKAQLEWLKGKYADEASEDVEAYLNYRAWDEPLGTFLYFDKSRFDDMISYPESYDLGWEIQKRIPKLSDERAEAINAGDKLSDTERKEVINLVDEKLGFIDIP